MKREKGNRASRYAGVKVLFATAVLLAPLVAKSALTVIMKTLSKKRT